MASSIFVLNGGVLTVGAQSLFPDGTATAPSMAFATHPTTGWFWLGSDNLMGTQAGTPSILINNNLVRLNSNTTLGWSSANVAGAVEDTTLTRGGAAGKITLVGTTPMLQFGGTTSSFPALKRNGARLDFRFGDDSTFTDMAAANGVFTTALVTSSGSMLLSMNSTSNPTVSSGFGTSPSITGNGASAFIVNVGTGGAATSGVVTLPTATTGWTVLCLDITSASNHTGLTTVQTASTTTSVTIESQNSAGAATAWAASSLVRCIALAY